MFGKRLAELRKKHGMSQQDFGDMLGISQNQVSRYERGENEPTAPVLIQVSRIFGTTPNYLLGLTDNPIPVTNQGLDDIESELIWLLHSQTRQNKERILNVVKALV